MHRGGTFVFALIGGLAVATPCLAIETGSPALPPPPPPPLSAAPPGAGASPAPRPRPPPSAPVTTSASSTASSPAAPADTGPGPTEPGMHALDTRWFIAPLLGYASENLDFGIGVRGGKTLDNPHIYIGGTFVYQIGQSGSYAYTTPTGATATGSWSSGGFYIGPEAGYDFDLKYVVLRPYMGIGLFDWSSSVSGPGFSGGGSGTQLVVWPGCMVVWNVPDSSFFIGGDVHVITVPGGSFALYAMGGLHFGS